MWREAIGYHPPRCTASGQGAWESEGSEMLIYPEKPLGFWPGPDIVCPTLPPGIIASLKLAPDYFANAPHNLMAANGFRPLRVGGVEADHEGDHPQVIYHNGYQAAVRLCLLDRSMPKKTIIDREQMDQMEVHLSMMAAPASSSFQGGHHVSPVVSPEASLSANRWMPPTYMQTPHSAYTWPSAFQTSNPTGYEDYQTANFGLPNLLPPYYNNWGYVNGPGAMSTGPAAHTDHAALPNVADSGIYPGGSFSSTHSVGASFSSTVSSSFHGDQSSADAYPPRAFHNSTPFERIKEMSSSPPSPQNYFASSASSPATMPGLTDSDAAHSSFEALPSVPSRSKKRTPCKGKGPLRKLPEDPARGRHARRRPSPPPPPKPAAIGKGRGITPAAPALKTHRHSRNTRSGNNSRTITAHQDPEPQAQLQHEPRVPRQAQLRPAMAIPPPHSALPPPPPSTAPSSPPQRASHLSEKDELLIHYREAGLGYSEIQQLCGFKEAVSTLRGRYRTLTKPKEARVRKPAWTDQEVSV